MRPAPMKDDGLRARAVIEQLKSGVRNVGAPDLARARYDDWKETQKNGKAEE